MSGARQSAARADDHALQQAAYFSAGTERALAMDNRGPVRIEPGGELHADILASFQRHGFYVFRGVLGASELADMEADLKQILGRLPAHKGAVVDAAGRPALGVDCTAPTLFWSKPLGDPFGGTDQAGGRHPVKMHEPVADASAPEQVVYLILGPLQFSDAFLRLYGHPDLLAVAGAVNGDDFVPFNEALFIKEPGRGASVAWHQDGTTHWDSPNWDPGCHGFNFMAQLYGSTAANGVWVVPGSHAQGRADIPALVAEAGSERLPLAVPLITDPGDVVICNRQILHGSFANTSEHWRVTFNLGFHRRASVLGVRGGGLHNAPAVYDEARISARSRLLAYAIDARAARYPEESPYCYQPFAAAPQRHRWSEEARADLHDYNLLDLSI